MTSDSATLPDWPILTKGWDGLAVFRFLVDERKLQPDEAIDQMNSRGAKLPWYIVRWGDELAPEWRAKDLFATYEWILNGNGEPELSPPPPRQLDLRVFPEAVREKWPIFKKSSSNAGTKRLNSKTAPEFVSNYLQNTSSPTEEGLRGAALNAGISGARKLLDAEYASQMLDRTGTPVRRGRRRKLPKQSAKK
jgi:hypothetical protein